jgi:hypothetical protein
MPCCSTCACIGTDVECLSVVDPVRFGYFAEVCAGTNEAARRHVLGRSRIGANPQPPRIAPVIESLPLIDRLRNDIPLAGDVVEAIAKRLGVDHLARWWESRTGKMCGCPARKEAMNRASEKLLAWAGIRPAQDTQA